METFNFICGIILKVFSVLTCYKVLYVIIGFLAKEKPLPPPVENQKKHKFGIVICARNEEAVIGNLIESIRKQTYDPDKITIFVCADNCHDNTAKICRDMGCVVYERFDPKKARKGYALQFLYENIAKDYGIESFDAFISFDADNLLKEDFVETMNRVFTDRSGVIVSYRNTKNFDTNVISAAYGIHFYRSTMTYHRPRRFLGLSTHIAGTGFLVNSRLLKDGWNCTCLTEDTEFTLKTIAKGEPIEFCEQAEFFDEQPHNFFVSWRQRMRWAKGRLFAFFARGPQLIAGIFKKRPVRKKISCYDIFFYAFPYALFSAILTAIYPITTAIISLVQGTFWGNLNFPSLALLGLKALATSYLGNVAIGALICIRERNHIHCTKGKLVFYILTWFWFSIVSLPVTIASLFMRVKWKPIKHDDTTKIEELTAKETVGGKNASSFSGNDTESTVFHTQEGTEYSGAMPPEESAASPSGERSLPPEDV